MINILYAGSTENWPDYQTHLPPALAEAGLKAQLSPDLNPAEVDYIVYAPNGPISDFTPFTRAKAVMSLWAGVEKIVGNQSLTMPLTRMVEDGLTDGMVEWVVGHTLRHHLGLDGHITRQDGVWRGTPPPIARDRKVGLLGLGALGAAAAQALAALKFDLMGWSRSPKSLEGIPTVSGEDGLDEVLRRSEILILLLPLTPETNGLLNAERLASLPDGAVILNPGRGPLIDDEALLAALDRLGHATLDVFRVEPLPPEHPFWAHPKVTVTPHIAADTRAPGAAKLIAENIRRAEAGEPLLHLADLTRGY